MKYLWLILMLVLLLSCKSKQSILGGEGNTTILMDCPENGTCFFEVLPNKNLDILKDDFGMLYPEIVEGDQLILKFKFERDTDSTTVDAHYIEEVFIEMDPNNLEKETTYLKSETLLFARLCFCRGQTGYYRIRKGKQSVKNIKGPTYQIELNFEMDEVPHVISSIRQIFSLK